MGDGQIDSSHHPEEIVFMKICYPKYESNSQYMKIAYKKSCCTQKWEIATLLINLFH